MDREPTASDIAEVWAELIEAAKAGDEKASVFLETFAPWAIAQLAGEPKH